MNIDKEKLIYLLKVEMVETNHLIYNVLNDSETDPHYSAVAATNRIKCYIEIMNGLGEELPYDNVKEYFKHNHFTEEQYWEFEMRRRKESEYYIGPQY